MRLYYIAAAEGRHRHVRSALGVNTERWNDFCREVRDWRLRLRDRYGIAPGVELQPLRLLDAGDPPSGEGPSMACMSREEAGAVLRSGLPTP